METEGAIKADSLPVVLLVVYAETYFVNLLPIARLLKSSGRFRPVFIFFLMHEANQRNVSFCMDEGMECLDPKGQLIPRELVQNQAEPAAGVQARSRSGFLRSGRLRMVRGLVRSLRQMFIDSVFNQLSILYRKQRLVKKVLKEHGVSLLLLPADNRYDFAVFVKVSKSLRLPVFIFPAFVNNALEMAGYVKNDPNHDAGRFFNHLTGMFFPKWIFNYEGRRLIHLPAGHVWAREMLGLAPPLPWILHSGYADVIALECEAVREFCVEEGIPRAQLEVTGAPVHDGMFAKLCDIEAQRDDLYRKLNLPLGKPLLLSALTPSAHNFPGGSPDCDFATYEELVEFWIKSLVINDKFNIIIALHPSMRFEDICYIEQWGVKISRERTSDLIPLCDMYVASISSTIQWAIACGKPVLNWDVYRLRNTVYYLGVEGVITIEEKAEFQELMRRFVEDSEFLKNQTEKQKREAAKWGVLDGMAGNRIISLIDNFIKHRAAKAANAGGG